MCSYSDRLAELPETVMTYPEAEEQFFKAPLDGYYCDGKLYGLPNEFNMRTALSWSTRPCSRKRA